MSTPAMNGRPSARAARRGPVLLAEDDPHLRELMADALREDGYEVIEAADGIELWNMIVSELELGPVHRPGLVISDIRMPGATGIEVLAALRECNTSMPVVLTTAFGDPETHAEAGRLGAETVLDKPFDIDDLRVAVRVLMDV